MISVVTVGLVYLIMNIGILGVITLARGGCI